MRPVAPPTWTDLPVSSSRCTRSISTRISSGPVPTSSTVTSCQPSVHSGSSYWEIWEVLRHVRIEVVLPREAAPRGDRAMQRQPDLDRVLHRHPVDDRQRSGQAQADRADPGVRLATETHG